MILIALSPILLLITLLIGFRSPLVKAAPAAFIFTVLLSLFFWNTTGSKVFASSIRGFLLSLDIVIILFGAIFFLEFLKSSSILNSLQTHITRLSPDRRIQAILIVWLFGSFVEGSAGFGTPAAIVAPLLVAIGFPTMTAILSSLAANSTAVAFGAVGTPTRIGFAGLDTVGVVQQAALINMVAGLIIPLIILWIVVQPKLNNNWRAVIDCIPWALWAGIAFLLPHYLLSFMGEELPSLVGALIGLTVVGLSLKVKFLLPKREFKFQEEVHIENERPPLSFIQSLTPYLILVLTLVLGKLVFLNIRFEWAISEKVTHTFNIFNPGFAFLTTIAFLLIIGSARFETTKTAAKSTSRVLLKPFLMIFFITSMIQIMIQSGSIALIAASFQTQFITWLAPLLGAFGSFVAGSATVSNLLMGPLLVQIAATVGVNSQHLLSLQLVGAAAGNIIALPNIIAVEAAVKESNKERDILLHLAPVCLLYLLICSFAGVLLDLWLGMH